MIDFHPCFFHLTNSLESVSICVSLHPWYLGFVTSFTNKNLFVKFMGKANKKSRKELIKDWLGNHYYEEFLLELANPVLMKIYYMGVTKHDLISNYQDVHNWCAIWIVFVWRFGFLFSGYINVTTSQRHWSCQCLGCRTSHFLYQPQGDHRFWLIPKSFQYESYSGVVTYNMMHVWITRMILWISFFKELKFIVIME
jgi:hypothetical protein